MQTSVNGTSVTVTWNAPANTGGSSILGFVVSTTGAPSCSTTSGAVTSCVFTKLSPGTYSFSVVATNAQGSSASATSPTITVSAPQPSVPGKPSFAVSSVARGQLKLVVTQPVSIAGVTNTGLQYTTGSGKWLSFPWSSTGIYIIKSLVSGRTYKIQVRAVNKAGVGAASIIRTIRVP